MVFDKIFGAELAGALSLAILLFLYVLGNSMKRPENIGKHFKEKIGLLPEEDKNNELYQEMSSGDLRRRTVQRI
ncbi:Oidioi.mRNA.OKI2018_I69.PAR.g9726.t1.cds [Oikopleura dioica]|uniref:Oidioi.mRNA.OKI2018_I69.PAR.g9726.t1.cds n=1 Tax=Oikopleura dioica TaxID=34765 RepID=A0ABN7RPX1_OIKDI|nr:Oidioi.mRNA.OKI2018_I69.PAR.g9726.t1.cds [Oikopleura dioica]